MTLHRRSVSQILLNINKLTILCNKHNLKKKVKKLHITLLQNDNFEFIVYFSFV